MRMISSFQISEIVLDIQGFSSSNNLVGRSRAETRTAMDDFSKLIHHAIACIGALAAKNTNRAYEVLEPSLWVSG
jgi:hypothetical protein